MGYILKIYHDGALKILSLSHFESVNLWQNLQPVAIRVFNEIDAHGFIFKANAAHLLVLFVRFLKIIRLKCQMEFTLSQVVSLGVVFQPGKLQLKIADIAS